MKPAVLLSLALLLCATSRADPPKTKDAFIAALRSAFDTSDIQRIHQLTWEVGMSDFDKDQQKQMLPMLLGQGAGVASISLEPLPPDFMDIPVAWGRRIEVTHTPDGMVRIVQKPKDKDQSNEMTMPYAVIGGVWYLVTSKTTDVGWKGPQDKSLQVAVVGAGREKVKIHVKYNASGVDIDMDPTSPSVSFPGQYISEVTVRSDSDDANVTLQLNDENGHTYYQSAPLVGKGEIDYHKGDPSAPAK